MGSCKQISDVPSTCIIELYGIIRETHKINPERNKRKQEESFKAIRILGLSDEAGE